MQANQVVTAGLASEANSIEQAQTPERKANQAHVDAILELSRQMVNSATNQAELFRCPAKLLALASADRQALHAALAPLILGERPADPKQREAFLAHLEALEDVYLAVNPNRALARSGLRPAETGSELSWRKGGDLRAYGWTSNQWEAGWYVRQALPGGAAGAFWGAESRVFSDTEEPNGQAGLQTLWQLRIPAAGGAAQSARILLPGKAVLEADFTAAEAGLIRLVAPADAFSVLVRHLAAESLISKTAAEQAESQGEVKLDLLSGGRLRVVVYSASTTAAEEILLNASPNNLRAAAGTQGEEMLARELADRNITAAYSSRMADFLFRRMDGGACSAIKHQSLDTVRLEIDRDLQVLREALQGERWPIEAQAEMRRMQKLLERASEVLPRFCGTVEMDVFGAPGISDSASIRFASGKTIINYHYAVMIGGPTPSPRQKVLEGENPFRGTYRLGADGKSEEREFVLVAPGFPEALADFVAECNHDGEGLQLRSAVLKRFVSELPPGAEPALLV